MRIFIYILCITILLEITLRVIINAAKKSMPWILTKSDEYPEFKDEIVVKFIENSFDANLGWVRKPNSSGKEIGVESEVCFNIDENGSRANPFTSHHNSKIAVFGDSYAFCRQVNDGETWECKLSELINAGVLNYGVGNYGIDQAIMRLEMTKLPSTVKAIILCFVPETICRVQSRWKHFLEFGNILAFKPRYILSETGGLTLLENPIKNISSFNEIKKIINEIKNTDKFYKTKFRKYQFRGLYLVVFIKNIARYVAMLRVYFLGKSGVISNEERDDRLFELIVDENIKQSHFLYGNMQSTLLLGALLQKFKDEVVKRGAMPVIIVAPQLMDLKNQKTRSIYQKFFQDFGSNHNLDVIDLTDAILKGNPSSCYINDRYGGHFSPFGNEIVANEVNDYLSKKGIRLDL